MGKKNTYKVSSAGGRGRTCRKCGLVTVPAHTSRSCRGKAYYQSAVLGIEKAYRNAGLLQPNEAEIKDVPSFQSDVAPNYDPAENVSQGELVSSASSEESEMSDSGGDPDLPFSESGTKVPPTVYNSYWESLQQEPSTTSQAATTLLGPIIDDNLPQDWSRLVASAVTTPVDTAIGKLQPEDIRSVTPGQYMHGTMLNCILRCLVTHFNHYDPDNSTLLLDGYAGLAIQDPNSGCSYLYSRRIVTSYGKQQPLEYRRLLIPWFLGNNHWSLVCVDHLNGFQINFGESLQSSRFLEAWAERVRKWYIAYYKKHCPGDFPLLMSKLPERFLICEMKVPRQVDHLFGWPGAWSCGTHVVLMSADIMRNGDSSAGYHFGYTSADVYGLSDQWLPFLLTSELPDVLQATWAWDGSEPPNEASRRQVITHVKETLGQSISMPGKVGHLCQGSGEKIFTKKSVQSCQKSLPTTDCNTHEECAPVRKQSRGSNKLARDGDRAKDEGRLSIKSLRCWDFLDKSLARSQGHTCGAKFDSAPRMLRHMNRSRCRVYFDMDSAAAKSASLHLQAASGFVGLKVVPNGDSADNTCQAMRKKTRKSRKKRRNNHNTATSAPDADPGGVDDPANACECVPTLIQQWYRTCLAELNEAISLTKGRTPAGHSPIQGSWPQGPGWDGYWRLPPKIVATSLSPQTYYYPRICFFAPELRDPLEFPRAVPKCPCCQSDTSVISEGWVKTPRQILGEHENYYVTCKRYRCTRSGQYFCAYLPDTLALMPRHVQLDFPAFLMERKGIDLNVVADMRMYVTKGPSRGFKGFAHDLRERHLNRWSDKLLHYYSRWDRHRGHQTVLRHAVSDEPEPFSEPDGEYGDWVASPAFLTEVFLKDAANRKHFFERQMQMIPGRIPKMDGMKKISKVIRMDNERAFEELMTWMNEHNMVMNQWLLETGSMEETKDGMEGFLRRQHLHGFGDFRAAYTDRCCTDRSFLERYFPSLRGDAVIKPSPRLPQLRLPAAFEESVVHVIYEQVAEVTCDRLLQHSTMGFDTEWSYHWTEDNGRSTRARSKADYKTVKSIVSAARSTDISCPTCRRWSQWDANRVSLQPCTDEVQNAGCAEEHSRE
eukprot:scaffold24665_cov44-Prasinocladus_malaysianus.AAC.2